MEPADGNRLYAELIRTVHPSLSWLLENYPDYPCFMKPEDIDNDAPLFGDGLGLDSIDALEIIVILDKYYGIKLANASEGKAIFKSIGSIAEYIEKHRTK